MTVICRPGWATLVVVGEAVTDGADDDGAPVSPGATDDELAHEDKAKITIVPYRARRRLARSLVIRLMFNVETSWTRLVYGLGAVPSELCSSSPSCGGSEKSIAGFAACISLTSWKPRSRAISCHST